MNVIGIVAGKGGVGKSTVTVNIALALKEMGFTVGIIDADIYGPSMRKMVGCAILPSQSCEQSERIVPAEGLGLKFISMAFFVPEEEAAVVRAPIANAVIVQFLNQVDWGELDYLLVDFPPGTGDIQLTLMQQGKLSGALLVTTPQEVALLDVRKATRMLQQLNVPILGVVENMSSFLGCFPFGKGGGEKLSKELRVPLLGEVPISPELTRCGDAGLSLFEEAKDSEAATCFRAITEQIVALDFGREEVASAELVETEGVRVTWKDGWERILPLAVIQKNCPCVRCQETKGDVSNVQANLLETIGRYAIKIHFSSGCSRGIYPFSLLRRLGI
jgi:ATP-binding protein involved in chromosome partitioning